MNVLMMVSWYSPHDAKSMTAGIFHYEQSIALQKYLNMALYYPYDENLNGKFLKLNEKGLVTYRRKKNRKLKYINWIHMFFDFARIYREFRPDIIHAHVALGVGKIAVVLGKIFHIPVIITEHNPIELMGLENARAKKQAEFAYKNSSANVCVSMDSRRRLKEFFPNERFYVIYNGIINPEFTKKDGFCYAKDGYVNCCIVAAFYDKEIKGYQYLLPAIEKIVKKGYPIILHICGGGEYFNYYVELAKRLEIEGNCIFYGQCNREKVYSIIRQMDFSISASIFECSGVSVQEAMLLGKPLVVTKSGGADSLVTEKTAIVVERESVSALVLGIEEMIRRFSEFDEKFIREYAYKNFEIDRVSRKYVKLYNHILKKTKV